MRQIDRTDWTELLEINECGRKILTLQHAQNLAAQGAIEDWYVAPYAMAWTIGRRASNGDAYHVLAGGEPVTFHSEARAAAFLWEMLPGGAVIRQYVIHYQHAPSPRLRRSRQRQGLRLSCSEVST
jgi:hypothetical protein